jgi:DNA-directed RNA polymerase specialized sigma24 family protein
MTDDDLRPGEWPDLSDKLLHRRLRRLAERRLWGNAHHADDVVSRAIVRWAGMDPRKSPAARLEQVIASEVSSLMRSETRLKRRELRSSIDRSGGPPSSGNREPSLLGPSLAESISRQRRPITAADVAILELLYEGHTISDIAETLGISRYAVLRCRELWRQIATAADPVPSGRSARRVERQADPDDRTDPH